jgi:hypothetical protein
MIRRFHSTHLLFSSFIVALAVTAAVALSASAAAGQGRGAGTGAAAGANAAANPRTAPRPIDAGVSLWTEELTGDGSGRECGAGPCGP